MSGSAPLRFLAVVLGGWAAVRTALVALPWPVPVADSAAVAVAVKAPAAPEPRLDRALGPVKTERFVAVGALVFEAAKEPPLRPASRRAHTALIPLFPAPAPAPRATRTAAGAASAVPPFAVPRGAAPAMADRAPTEAKRWSLSAWSFVRQGDTPPLAAAGMLGGSQAGARLGYRLNRDPGRPLALSARLSAPLQSASGAEASLGIDWKPVPSLPVHLLAERRQALGRKGRSAFSVTLYGGVSDSPAGPFRIDAYAQAGIVGARSSDPFADGSLRLSLPLGRRARLGAGAWAAAQPGVARLDVGPQAALRLPVAGRAVTLAADWRLRVAGDAEPGSGPTLTLATDF